MTLKLYLYNLKYSSFIKRIDWNKTNKTVFRRKKMIKYI